MREASTLVLLAGERVVRADFAPGAATPSVVLTAPRQRGISMADSVRAALALGGKIRHAVWVLAGELWTQSIALNRNQVSGLTDEQLGRALSFEIEPFSGIPIAESALGFRRGSDEVDGAPSFWVVEMTIADRNAVQRAVSEAGGKLMGIGHPGGIPKPLGGEGRNWCRLESWESGLLWVTSDPERGVRVRAVNSAPSRASLPPSGIFELLGAGSVTSLPGVPSDLPWNRFSLQDEAELRFWLQQWRESFHEKTPALPVVAPALPPPSARKYVVAAAVVEFVVLGICAGHWAWTGHQRTLLNRQQAELATAARQLDEATKQNLALRKRLTEVRAANQQRTRIAARRDALAALLRALATAKPDDILLRSIKAEGPSSMTVSGVSLEAVAVDEMSITLNQTLSLAGWSTQPLQKNARGTLSNNGPWDFSIRVAHDSANPASVQPRTASKGGMR